MKLKTSLYGGLLLLCVFCSTPVWAQEVYVSAAASLKEALTKLSDIYTRSRPEVKVLTNLGASGALARQIENGAPADLFISANTEWMEALKTKQCVDAASVTVLAGNALVLVGRAGSPFSGFKDIAAFDRLAVGNPNSVPAGVYAMAALTKAGLAASMQKKLVFAKDVRQALFYAEQGEVQGALVYRTDALSSRKIGVLMVVPEALCGRIRYPMALTARGAKRPEASDFYRFLKTPAAQAVLADFGFERP